MDLQTLYQKAIAFATKKHAEKNQTVPGTDLPYVVHLSNVAMEILVASTKSKLFNTRFAVQVALLHDILEDTDTTFEEISKVFSIDVAEAVLALTKNNSIPKDERMNDSLNRIKKLSNEVSAIKLADRITNLQPPPKYWSLEKILLYQKEAIVICENLKGTNYYLENRLKEKINEYSKYCLKNLQ